MKGMEIKGMEMDGIATAACQHCERECEHSTSNTNSNLFVIQTLRFYQRRYGGQSFRNSLSLH